MTTDTLTLHPRPAIGTGHYFAQRVTHSQGEDVSLEWRGETWTARKETEPHTGAESILLLHTSYGPAYMPQRETFGRYVSLPKVVAVVFS